MDAPTLARRILDLAAGSKVNVGLVNDIALRVKYSFPLPLNSLPYSHSSLDRRQSQVFSRITRHLKLLFDTVNILVDLPGLFRDSLHDLSPPAITISLRKLAGAFQDLGADLVVKVNKNALLLQEKLEALPEKLQKAETMVRQQSDVRDPQFMAAIFELLDAHPTADTDLFLNVLADINNEEKQACKRVDDVAQVITSQGTPESDEFWLPHFGTQSSVPWRQFQDAFAYEQFGFVEPLGYAQLTSLLRFHLDLTGTGIVSRQQFAQFLDNQWDAVRTEFVPQRGLKLNVLRTDATTLPLLVTSVLHPNWNLRVGMTFALTSQGYPLSMRRDKDGITVFGRKSERNRGLVDIQLDDISVSLVHAQIVFKSGRFWLVDLGSTGGTYILMQGPTLLRPGLVFQLSCSDVFVVTEVNGEALSSLEELDEEAGKHIEGEWKETEIQAEDNFANTEEIEAEERFANLEEIEAEENLEDQVDNPEEIDREDQPEDNVSSPAEIDREDQPEDIVPYLAELETEEQHQDQLVDPEELDREAEPEDQFSNPEEIEDKEMHPEEAIPTVQPTIKVQCVLKGEHLGTRWRFTSSAEGITFGRSEDCSVILRNSRISGQHCRFAIRNGAWVLEDVDSANMIWVSVADYQSLRRKEPSGAVPLESGSCFKIGCIDFLVGG